MSSQFVSPLKHLAPYCLCVIPFGQYKSAYNEKGGNLLLLYRLPPIENENKIFLRLMLHFQ